MSASVTPPAWALVPVRGLAGAKSRLAAVLSAERRADLQRAMLEDVLSALGNARRLQGVAVVSADRVVAEIARRHGAMAIAEAGPHGLDAAVAAGAATLGREGAGLVIAVPGDVPLIEAADVDRAVATKLAEGSTVVVPDRHDDGTNALVFDTASPPAFSYGPGSFRRHVAGTGGRAGIALPLASLALDIDTPEDLAALIGAALPSARMTRASLTTPGGGALQPFAAETTA